MCEVYKIFSSPWKNTHNFDNDSIVEMFNHESFNSPISQNNGYLLGKKWLNVTVTMWKEDIQKGYLFKHELYEDGRFPVWWLDSVLKKL